MQSAVFMEDEDINLILKVIFYRSETNNEPVREWIKSLSLNDKLIIGQDIKTVQFGWPLGMPLVRKMESDLWEIRIKLENKIARILFTVKDNQMILLHGFIKKISKNSYSRFTNSKKKIKTNQRIINNEQSIFR